MNFLNYSKSVKHYLIGTFISSIGDGMFALAISKLAFDKTGTVAGVGVVIIIQSLTAFILNFIAGYVVDNYDSKKISIYSDFIQAIIIILYIFFMDISDSGGLLLFLLTSIISCISPFFRAANFKLLPEIDRGKLSLVRLNGLRSSVKQGGLLLGSALIAPFIVFHLLKLAFVLNGVSFLVSCFCTQQIVLKDNMKNTGGTKLVEIYRNWFLLLKELLLDSKMFYLILFSTFDYLTINFINLIGIKYAEIRLHQSAFISLIDGGYAIGAICSFLLITYIFSKYSFKHISWIGLFVQGIAIILMDNFSNVYTTGIFIFLIGVFTGTSISLFQTVLHKIIPHKFHGKISSFRDMLVSIETLLIIPIFSYLVSFDFWKSMLVFGGIMIVLSSILMYLGLINYFPDVDFSDDKV